MPFTRLLSLHEQDFGYHDIRIETVLGSGENEINTGLHFSSGIVFPIPGGETAIGYRLKNEPTGYVRNLDGRIFRQSLDGNGAVVIRPHGVGEHGEVGLMVFAAPGRIGPVGDDTRLCPDEYLPLLVVESERGDVVVK